MSTISWVSPTDGGWDGAKHGHRLNRPVRQSPPSAISNKPFVASEARAF